MVEKVVPTQLMHCVRSAFGPAPAAHAEHDVLSLLTTFGAAQSWHWPMVEKVVPAQLMHCVRSAFGPAPAAHVEHVVLSVLTTFGAAQS